jgi:hypothetical protein
MWQEAREGVLVSRCGDAAAACFVHSHPVVDHRQRIVIQEVLNNGNMQAN